MTILSYVTNNNCQPNSTAQSAIYTTNPAASPAHRCHIIQPLVINLTIQIYRYFRLNLNFELKHQSTAKVLKGGATEIPPAYTITVPIHHFKVTCCGTKSDRSPEAESSCLKYCKKSGSFIYISPDIPSVLGRTVKRAASQKSHCERHHIIMAKFESLRQQLSQGRVLLPGDDGYDDSLKRWSATCIKPAVSRILPTDTHRG